MKYSLVLILLFTIGGLVLGLVAGPPVAHAQAEGAYTHWRSYEAPPEPAIRILGYEFGVRNEIFVRTEADSGAVFRCCEQKTGEWREAAPSELVYSDPCQDLPSQAPAVPRPIVDCVEAAAYEWATDRTQFALLDDGTVWTWQHRIGIFPLLSLVCLSIIAATLLGAVFAGALEILRRRRRTPA